MLKIYLILVSYVLSFSAFGIDFIPFKYESLTQKAEVKSGHGLFQALKSVNIEGISALQIINALRDEVEFSKIKVGDKLEASFDLNNQLVEFSYSQNPAEKHIVQKNPLTQSWDYRFHQEETNWEARIIEGELKAGSTLHQDMLAQELTASVVNEVVQVLLCKVNFRQMARSGDRYKALLYERKYQDQIIETKVLYTAYLGKAAGNYEAFYYEKEKGSTYNAHYTEEGEALINSGLRYPLTRLHIRSGYGMRHHPVTGHRAMHHGVDYRASVGTPVHAVAQGKVVTSTFNEFAGNKVAIRHSDGSTSFYLHLDRKYVKEGAWVKPNDVIGTVGATGRVTGAHLHFGFKDTKGKWMNPLNKRMIATPKLEGELLADLQNQIESIKGLMIDLQVREQAPYLLAQIPNLPKEANVFEFLTF
jgi:murein DD-endopeptidase MepM/ murein hydrolase activator NlpD